MTASNPIRYGLAGLIFVLLLSGCKSGPNPPDNLLSEEVYTDLLLETFMASYMIEMEGLAASSDSVYRVLYDSYGVTRAEFDSSHTWYNRDPETQKIRVDTVRNRLAEEVRNFDQFINEDLP